MNDPNDVQHIDDLLPSSTGIWRITTLSSIHVLDLDTGTATRFPGPRAPATVNDRPRPLRSLDVCRVGERGRWTMHTDGWSDTVDYFWHVTSTILRIEKVASNDSAKGEAAVDR